MPRYEMCWDCPRCDTRGLLGLSHRHCPNCGAPQDPSRRYFPPEDQKVAVEDHPFVGRDRICGACESPNARAAHNCVNCGASLEEAGDVRLVTEAATKPVVPVQGGGPPEAKAAPPRTGRRWWPWIVAIAVLGGLAILVCVGAVAVEFFYTKPATLTVAAKTWERSVAVEEYRTVRDDAWRDVVPTGARDVSCHREQRSTNRVADGQDCHDERVDHGDGTFSEEQRCSTRYREEPVYDQKCSYAIDRWVVARTERLAGTSDTPVWPAPAVGGVGVGATRTGGRQESYGVTLSNGTDQWPCTVGPDVWDTMPPGSMWTARMGGLSGRPDCGALQPFR